jgi:hypothetical protein
VTIEKDGFRSTTLTKIPVSVGAPTRVDAKLTPGMVQEAVEVIANVPMVETASNTSGATLEAAEVVELPVNGRDYTKLLSLVPGASGDPNGSNESAGSYGLFSLNGNRGRSNNYLLDGTDMNDGYRNLPSINQAGVWGAPATILPIDALAEIPVTGNTEAEFGRSAGATVNIVTKSGANQIHGSAYEYYRNDSLSARNAFNTVDQPKNSFTNHQFGASAGGPLIKDNTFWFLAYEGQREDGGLPQLGTVPVQSDIDTYKTNYGQINQVAQSLLDSKPWGTLPATGSGSETFSTPFHNDSDNVIAKFDKHLHWFSPGDLFTGRYFYSHGLQSFPLGMLYTGSSAPGFNTTTPTHVNIASLSYTSIPRPNLIVEIRGGYNRYLQQFLPQDIGLNPETAYGLDTLPSGYTSRDLGLPTIAVGSYSTIGATASDSRGRADTNYQLFGNISLTHGRHSFKTGYEWRRTFINSFIDSGHRGKLVFDSLDDFLGGTINGSKSSSTEGNGTRYSFQNASGAYLLDSWHVSSKLTLNYGLRWDYFGVVGAKNHAFSIFNVKTGEMETIGAAGGPASLYPKEFGNISPRISLIDDLAGNGKLVLRASAGLYYDSPSQDFFVGNQAYNTNSGQQGPIFNDITFASTVASSLQAGSQIFSNYVPSSVFTVDQNLTTPRYGAYTFNAESQITNHVSVELGYVGSQGRHLFRLRDLNQYNNVAGSMIACPNGTTIGYGYHCYSTYTIGAYGAIPLSYVNQIETTSQSSYNSMQATLKIENWHGLTSTFNYTWAHSIDTASDGEDFVPNAAMPDNNFNPRAERASSNFDVRQRVQWYWTYNFPKSHTAGWLLSGWAADGLFNFASGQPYTVSYLFDSAAGGNYNGNGEGFGRPDIIGNPYAGAHGADLLNLAAFAAPCTIDTDASSSTYGDCINGHPGSEGRNAFNATNFTNMDFSLTKTTKLREKLTMQLRADLFNIFNHPNFTNPLLPGFGIDAFSNNHTEGNKLIAGSDPSANGTQYLQTTATPDVGSGNPYLGGGGPRSAQLAVHLTF